MHLFYLPVCISFAKSRHSRYLKEISDAVAAFFSLSSFTYIYSIRIYKYISIRKWALGMCDEKEKRVKWVCKQKLERTVLVRKRKRNKIYKSIKKVSYNFFCCLLVVDRRMNYKRIANEERCSGEWQYRKKIN